MNINYSRTFHRSSSEGPRSFVHFLLEPLYKLFSITLAESNEHIKQTYLELGVTLKKYELEMDVAPLLRLALSRFFGTANGFVDMVTTHLPNPLQNATNWLEHTYSGSLSDPIVEIMQTCDSEAPLVIHIAKLYPKNDASSFDAFGRILSGTVKMGQSVNVLGEGYSIEDEEDSVVAQISQVSFYQSRYQIHTPEVSCGNLVLLGGVSASLVKTGTLVDLNVSMSIFAPLHHVTRSVVKVAIEPVQPSELPKMLEGLRKINKSYPLAVTKVEESGEHILLGTGELYMDCILHDLRRLYTEIEIKVSDPVTKFSETVSETSAFKCFAESPNRKNKLTMLSLPLDKSVGYAIEQGELDLKNPSFQKKLEEEFDWDVLASRSIWAFGPDNRGPNVLMDDTLPTEVDKNILYTVKESIKQGFQWGTREGPLCDEPMKYCQFKLIDAQIASEPMYRGGGQLIPTTRRLVHSSFLMATPRLMEPIFFAEIQTPAECISAVYSVLTRRRGHITQEIPKSGSPLYTVKAYIPVIDSFGFETDLRTHTQGQAFSQHMFDHDRIVPGDPVDKSIVLRPLEPAPTSHLARDFMIKTRRRKGLSEDVAIAKYFDEPMLLELAQQSLDLDG
ncbi:U5 small nuclear ribonucleoprotein component [Coelomomyces lativittatus]|nr:U5 small nuclear ribonucleoprotein component [Coelomomyces lativittatus]